MPTRCLSSIASVALLAVASTPALAASGPVTYAFDPVHTRVVFAIEHAGFSSALGAVSGSTGTLQFDRDDWRSARVDVTVPLTRLDLGDEKWNEATAKLLDSKRYPEARFVSQTVEPLEADHAKACGELTLHGVTRPLCMDVRLNALKRHPLPPFRRTAGFSATATLSRAEFGITEWKSVIGDEVQLRIEAEAVRNHRAGDAIEDAKPDDEPEPNKAPQPGELPRLEKESTSDETPKPAGDTPPGRPAAPTPADATVEPQR